MNPWINYHHLLYFKTIAEEGTVSRAAQKLRLGQPTLSAQLNQFEKTLGVQLFDRQHKKLILTEQGKIALDYARGIFQMGSEMYEVLHDRLIPQQTAFHIGALDSIPKQVILQLVKQSYKTQDCFITLSEGKLDELLPEVINHRIDLLVTNFLPSGPSASALKYRSITKKEVAIFGSPNFKNLRKNFPKSIEEQPMIFPTYDSKLRHDLDHWGKVNCHSFKVIAESQDIAVKKLMAIEGLGLIPTARHTVMRQVLSGELIEIGVLKGVYEELIIATSQRKIENPIAAKLLKSFSL